MKIVCKKLVSLFHYKSSFIDKHIHHNHELVYCAEGVGYTEIEDKKYKFSAGNYYITTEGMLHNERDFCGTRIIYFYFDAPKELVPTGMFTDYEGNIFSCVKKLKTETDTMMEYKEDMIECLIKTILIDTMRMKENPKFGISAVVQYIDENIEHDIDFRILAGNMHYSYERFRHLFKDYTGMSPHQYLISQRLEKAKFLLKQEPRLSLTEISYKCGFSSSSHFTKAFRSKQGMSPSEYLHNRSKSK